jgi:hypothetical protein
MFRQWTPPKCDPEIARLEKETQKIRQQIHDLRDYGRQKRLNRLQALDALETKRVTLTEILRRMDKELEEKDVYKYSDILAEVFGERKIFAHRAIGLESLLCQFMHQMLAKQHQLKIIKKSAKDIQSKYKKYKLHNKNEFHVYEALAVQAEASRLSLEAIYDDIFASQHRMFALLHQGEAGEGTITNYSKPNNNTKKLEKKASLTVSTKHPVSREDYDGAQTPDSDGAQTPDSTDGGNESDDYEAARDILSQREEDDADIHAVHADEKKEMAELEVRKSRSKSSAGESSSSSRHQSETSPAPSKREAVGDTSNRYSSRRSSRRSSESSTKSARERRREIEHLRHARVVGGASKNASTSGFDVFDEEEGSAQASARERVRELETKRQSLSSPVNMEGEDKKTEGKNRSRSPKQKYGEETEEEQEDQKQKERKDRREKRASRKSSKQDIGFE